MHRDDDLGVASIFSGVDEAYFIALLHFNFFDTNDFWIFPVKKPQREVFIGDIAIKDGFAYFFSGETGDFSLMGFKKAGVTFFELHEEPTPFLVIVELKGDIFPLKSQGERGSFSIFAEVTFKLAVLKRRAKTDSFEDTLCLFIRLDGKGKSK